MERVLGPPRFRTGVATSSSLFQGHSPGDEDIATPFEGAHDTRHTPETLFECRGFAW